MAGLKFYNDLLSQPCRAIWIFLKLNNIPFEDKKISILKGEQNAPEYVEKFPTGKVPAIEDDGFAMIESVAILQYLCAKYNDKVASNWYPCDIHKKARVDEVICWQHTNIRQHGTAYLLSKFVSPVIWKTPVNEAKIQEIAIELGKSLDFMEQKLLTKSSFLSGDDVTLADLLCICEVMDPVAVGYDATDGRPKLAAWMERVKSRVGCLFDEAHKEILDLPKAK